MINEDIFKLGKGEVCQQNFLTSSMTRATQQQNIRGCDFLNYKTEK